jgi:circadian clock protein KaiC
MGMPLADQMQAGRVLLQQIDPAELSPGEFVHLVRAVVEPEAGQRAKVVVLDSLNGYLHAMPQEHFLTLQLHELLTYLGQIGVVTFLVVAQRGLVGVGMESIVDATYLADIEIVLRFFEAGGRLRRAISVPKKRSGPHEDTIRELRLTGHGIEIGPPLEDFDGVLTGVPTAGGVPGSRPRVCDERA